MKMIYGGVPVNSMKLKHYEISTNDCDMIASDLQAGKTAVARGKKIVGTGKSFEFAFYGQIESNDEQFIPSESINVIQVSSLAYPIKLIVALNDMSNIDFSVGQIIGNIVVDSIDYPLTVISHNNTLIVNCDLTIPLEVFYGKDNYI